MTTSTYRRATRRLGHTVACGIAAFPRKVLCVRAFEHNRGLAFRGRVRGHRLTARCVRLRPYATYRVVHVHYGFPETCASLNNIMTLLISALCHTIIL